VITDFWANAVFSVTPTIIIGLIFLFVMRAILRADRTERSELDKYEREERARRGLDPKG
jgi:hypothetical protein